MSREEPQSHHGTAKRKEINNENEHRLVTEDRVGGEMEPTDELVDRHGQNGQETHENAQDIHASVTIIGVVGWQIADENIKYRE